MRVLVLYNEPILAADHPDADSEHEVLFTVDEVAQELTAAGHEVSRLGVQRNPATLISGVRKARPHVVFNLFEGLADHYETESYATGLLDWLRVPYTGSPFETLALGRNKPRTKQLLRGAGLPTADFFLVEDGPVEECPLDWPVFVKPAAQDASVGIDQGSVVNDLESLNARVAFLIENYGGPVLVEEYIPGREFNVGLIETPELQTLPIGEILFEDRTVGSWPIVTYDSKWRPGSQDYEMQPVDYPQNLTPRLQERLQTLAKRAFRLLGCRDYARVDFRVRAGKPYILEVNPNPDYSPVAGLAIMLQKGGYPHAQFTAELVQMAYARRHGAGKVMSV